MRTQLLYGWIGLSIGAALGDWLLFGEPEKAVGKIFWMGVAFAWVAFKARSIHREIV